jgi:hypothetical protein
MSSNRRIRRLAALAATGLVAAVLPLAAPAAPVLAAGACMSEVPTGSLFTTICDDVDQPETAITKVTPAPNSKKYISVDHVTFTFGGAYTDADADPITYQCQFYLSINPPADWQPCTSPATYDKLEDVGPNDPVPYTFRVRAVDKNDNDINAKSCASPLTCTPAATDVVDYDESPDSTTLRVDTHAPDTYIFNAPADAQGSDYPMTKTRTVSLRLDSSEGTDSDPLKFTCKLDENKVDCAQGVTTLTGLGAGNHKFSAAATDLAGNTDPSPQTVKFSVPRNLVASSGWITRREGGYFSGDYIEAKKVGAQVSVPGKNVRELLLIAPAGPGLGKVEVKIGNSIWRTVNLKADKYVRFKVYKVRDQYDPLVSGKILIRVKSLEKNQVARIDAVLAH